MESTLFCPSEKQRVQKYEMQRLQCESEITVLLLDFPVLCMYNNVIYWQYVHNGFHMKGIIYSNLFISFYLGFNDIEYPNIGLQSRISIFLFGVQ